MWKQYGRVAANTHVDDDQRGQFAFWVIFGWLERKACLKVTLSYISPPDVV